MKKIRSILRKTGIITVILCIGYLLGPKPETPKFSPEMPVIMARGAALDSMISAEENALRLKPDNEARIVWADTIQKAVTPYSMVYLHGFSASQEEGDPVHQTLAKRFGCNLYLSRLSMHGIDTSEQLLGLTADNYWESAKKALAIGKQIGEKIILIGTSTGGTQALQLAATFPNDVAALILFSPNIEINDPNAWLLNNPWGLQIAKLVVGGDYNTPKDSREIYKQYWNSPYRLEAAVELQEMLESSMKVATFKQITQPLLLLYYYKDEAHQDPVVRVKAMRKMFQEIATPISLKKEVALPLTGDHVIGSYIKSKDIHSVIFNSEQFLHETLKLPYKLALDSTLAEPDF